MEESILTEASILENEGFLKLNLSQTDKFRQSKYILIIRADTTNFTRIMIYPVDAKKILKLTFIILKERVLNVRKLPFDFNNFKVIHNSGLILRKDKFVGEIYFNLSYLDPKYNELKIYLNRNKGIFKKTELNEISTLY